MIYSNFLFFFAAIVIFAMAPVSGESLFPSYINIYGILLTVLVFWHFNRYKFSKLRSYIKHESITIEEGKRAHLSIINIHIFVAIFLFAGEVFLFDLKRFLVMIPGLGEINLFVNAAGLAVFMLHLSIIWFWAFQAVGDVVSIGSSPGNYVKSNVKFNLAIIIPWLSILLILDLLEILIPSLPEQVQRSFFFHVVFFGLFLFVFSTLAPIFITRVWDCKPLEDAELKNSLISFSRSQGVKFKNILSWNALNGGLITAGVIGLLYPFRYLMITPELMNLLDKDELLGVTCHEVGHVKKKHMLYYFMFFLGFVILIAGIQPWIYLFFSTSFGFQLYLSMSDKTFSIFWVLIIVLLLIFYLRFIFGYFMRNFERQADMFCFEAGVDPNHLISSFVKLKGRVGDDEKKPNWHHYNIAQRIGFLEKCIDSPREIAKHNKKIKTSLRGFAGIMVVLTVVSFFSYGIKPDADVYLERMTDNLKRRIIENPENPELYATLGEISYQLEKWEQSKEAYENSLQLKYEQPNVLNNLAWLYLKCPAEEMLNHQRALTLAKDAVKLNQSPHILDTLAEAYFQNSMYDKAYIAARRAFRKAVENRQYYKEQLEKMQKFYLKFKSSIKI